MAIYRFKISFEDYDEVEREIDIKSIQTFEDLHRALHRSTGYPAEVSSSFYVSNDNWNKGQEITFLPWFFCFVGFGILGNACKVHRYF